MKNEYTVNDKLDHLTVLYHKNCKKGFKFFGDDPEEYKQYIKEEHADILRSNYPEFDLFPHEFLLRFYAHSRCLVFTDGIWMSETAAYPQYLRYRPGSYCNFRVSGLTRFTALTDGASAICVGIDPDAGKLPCYRRIVHSGEKQVAVGSDTYLIPTRDCTYDGKLVKEGSIVKSKGGVVIFQEKGLLIEYTQEPFAMGESVLDYGEQWYTKKVEVFNR